MGRWRLVDPAELDSVVLYLSHILIRHDAVSGSDVPFNYLNWRFPFPDANRSRREAWALCEEIAERARRQPESFAELAREFSEDLVTRDAGGSLGGIVAPMFVGWPELLDVFAETPERGVSRVVETPFGFHVFQRRPPAAEQVVSGEHIVIGHDDAPGLVIAQRGPLASRSRAEAFAIANRVFAEARRQPESFRELSDRYSEHEDAARAGDFGAWSTREWSPFAREIETLAGLAVGDIAPPLDTGFGYRVLRRTANRPRPMRALTRIELRFDDTAPDSAPDSRASVLATARSLIRSIAGDPARFDEVQKNYCCSALSPAMPGRFPPAVEAALERLQVDQVSAEPVLYSGMMYMILKRVDPARLPAPPTPRFELPSPKQLDLAYLMRSREAPLLERELQLIAAKAGVALELPAPMADELRDLHEPAGHLSSTPPAQRLSRVRQLQSKVQALLGPARYTRYEAIAQEQFEQLAFHTGEWAPSEKGEAVR